jgi:hypothetical protein
MTYLAVLIVAYRRPKELLNLVESLSGTHIKIYVYVDYDENNSSENQEVLQIAKSLQITGVITCWINSENVGVGRAVPSAIDWSLESEDYILVLEDDCELGEYALSYFLNSRHLISGKIAIVSGRSAWSELVNSPVLDCLTLTNLALTNGFLVSKQSWTRISRSLVHPKLGRRYLISILSNPRNFLVLSYMYSACLVNTKISMKAWDCFIVFEMLVSSYYSVNPNLSTISTRGIDHVASNTKIHDSKGLEYVVRASRGQPSTKIDMSRNSIILTNRQISRNIYGVKIQNLFSPIKSWLKIFKYKFL